jgi:hypothetical protein
VLIPELLMAPTGDAIETMAMFVIEMNTARLAAVSSNAEFPRRWWRLGGNGVETDDVTKRSRLNSINPSVTGDDGAGWQRCCILIKAREAGSEGVNTLMLRCSATF